LVHNKRVGAFHVFAEEVVSLSVKLDCAMTRRTQVHVEVEGNSSTRLTVIPFATAQSGNTPSLENLTIVSLYLLEVISISIITYLFSYSTINCLFGHHLSSYKMNLIAIILIVFLVERLKIKIGPYPSRWEKARKRIYRWTVSAANQVSEGSIIKLLPTRRSKWE